MCLHLDWDWEEKTEKLKKRNWLMRLLGLKKKIIAYKVLVRHNDDFIVSDVHRDWEWHKRINESDRETTKLDLMEEFADEVNRGFHFYLKKSEAKKRSGSLIELAYKFEIDPEDVVAVGKYGQMVATRCKLIGEV